MLKRTPYDVIRARYRTAKSKVVESLQQRDSNRCLARCKSPKAVFLVDLRANKQEIALAIAKIYPDVTVVKVNTVRVKGKKRRLRGRSGYRSQYKKAILTLAPGHSVD